MKFIFQGSQKKHIRVAIFLETPGRFSWYAPHFEAFSISEDLHLVSCMGTHTHPCVNCAYLTLKHRQGVCKIWSFSQIFVEYFETLYYKWCDNTQIQHPKKDNNLLHNTLYGWMKMRWGGEGRRKYLVRYGCMNIMGGQGGRKVILRAIRSSFWVNNDHGCWLFCKYA